jgi:hypothetical protein
MYKRAIAIFALSILFLSCAAQVANTPQPPPAPPVPPPASQPIPPLARKPALLPNLTILDISLSETGKIEVMLKYR